ncbi:hypothetical protein AGMMS50276_29470 [Synergistales bacterium]|nr:hypothetical protein AGMMS50276_29470 [Synergistales bacterium]
MTHDDVIMFRRLTKGNLEKVVDILYVVREFALDSWEEEDLTPEQIRVKDFLELLRIAADYASDAMDKIDKFAELAKDGAAK